MSLRSVCPRLLMTAAAMWGSITVTAAQSPSTPQEQHQHAQPPAGEHEAHRAAEQQEVDHAAHDAGAMAREGSGTAWLPDETPMFAVHARAGAWTLMTHGNAFLQYLHEGGDRGSEQTGSINWIMLMANRPLGRGQFGLRGMLSLEPWTIGGCGYPDLLATGEVCDGGTIHDRQHQHDLFMEVAAEYRHPLGRGVTLQVYGGPAGEPALGPVAFPHRVSAMPNALAPITHHWFDSTHITFGVVTAGVHGGRWKAESSIFNGREPDETRTNFDFAALDSFAGRLWFLPTKQWALQISAGHLNEAEPAHHGDARIDVDRVTASATYHRQMGSAGLWATTMGWGRNAETGEDATNAFLVETSVAPDGRNTFFGRFEVAGKSGHDLDLELDDIFTVAKLQGGYTRYFGDRRGLTPGIGAAVSTGIVPEALEFAYGRRANFGFGVFLTVRPAKSMN